MLFALMAHESSEVRNISTEPLDCLKCKDCGNFMDTRATLCVGYFFTINPFTLSFTGAALLSYSKIVG